MTGLTQIFRALIVLAVVVCGGCAETTLPQASGKGSSDAINAIPDSPGLIFLIEEQLLGTVGFKESLGPQPFDDLSYNFNFDLLFVGDAGTTRIATQFIDVVADTDYTVVITGSIAAPILTLWERPERVFDAAATVFEAGFAHLSPSLGDVDVYLATTGTMPVLGEERAKLSYGDTMPGIDLEAGQFEVIVTARDQPGMILYQSFDTFFGAGFTYTITIFDADPSITGDYSVRLITSGGASIELADSRIMPTLRTIHAAFGTENIDIYRDEDFTAPIYSDLGFGESTGDLSVPNGTVLYTYTTVGDTSMIIDEESQLVPRGLRITAVLAGLLGSDLTRILVADDRRSIVTHAKLRLIQAAANFPTLDVYIVDAGADITDLDPTLSSVSFGLATDFVAQVANSYDLILTLPAEKTVIAGPISLVLADGDVVDASFTDTVDPMVADIILTSF